MSDLPAGWEWATLGELASSVKNGVFVSRPGVDPDGVPILRISAVRAMRLDLNDLRYSGKNVDELAMSDALLEPGDLLFTRYSGNPDYVGACARVPERIGVLSYPDKLIRVRVPGLDSRYLEAAFSSPVVRASVAALLRTTAGQVGISGSALKSVRIPIAPAAEQQRIVATLEYHLSRLSAGTQALNGSVSRARRLRDTVVAAACSGAFRDCPGDVAAEPEDVGLQDGVLPTLPANWRWVRLQEIADVVGGVTKDAKRQSDPSLREIPYLRVANVQRGHLDLSDVRTIRVADRKIEELALRVGDVLLNEGGDRDKLARGWIWEGQLPLCIHQNHVFRARIRDSIIDPKILAWHANGFGQRWAEANGKQSVNLASISLKKVRLMPVPVPPLPEQASIVEKIEQMTMNIDRLELAVAATRNQAEHLSRSLLREAFTGCLTSQDPNDEPARILLDQTRSRRALETARRANGVSRSRTRLGPELYS